MHSWRLRSAILPCALLLCGWSLTAFALPQHQRLLRQEYGFKAPCSTCHSQGGGSSLSPYGKAFDRAGKGPMAIKKIASIVPQGDTLSFGDKLKSRANPNDPKSTPSNPGPWAGGSDIPTQELKTFSPAEISNFTLLEGELKAEQIERLKAKLGDLYQEEDKYPTFYFGEVGGKKSFVVQYVSLPKTDKTIGLVVSTKGAVVNLAYVGKEKGEVPKAQKDKLVGLTLAEVEKLPKEGDAEAASLRNGVVHGLTAINLVFGKL